jgi:adenylate cyclase
MIDVQPIFDWLVDGAPGAPTPPAVLARACPELVAAGIPLDQVEAFVRTLHPHIVGRSFRWRRGGQVEVRENTFAYLQSEAFRTSPIAEVCATGKLVRVRPGPEGFTDFLTVPMTFMSGQVHAITFATRAPGGFTDEHVAGLLHIARPLTRVGEILALSRTAANLLNTYVGRNAGERILAGHIQRGDTDTLGAVIWFSDLRGFTALSGAMPPGSIIRVLNDLFECQVPAIEHRGGEVLKFIGDGLLAIFPIGEGDRSAAALADLALDAAEDAFTALDDLNRARTARGDGPIRFGLALHVGDVAYGNIGGAGRLDFTCIGPAVNLASRLEGLTSRLDRPIVLSRELAALTSRPTESLGTFELKGVSDPQEVFGLAGV